MRIGRIVAGAVTLLALIYAGGSLYVLRKAHLGEVVLCASGEPGLHIPAAACRQYVARFAAGYSAQEKSSALMIALAKATFYSAEPAAQELALGQFAALLKQGADINAISPHDGLTPLNATILANKPELVRYLLEAGADPSKRDAYFERTPLELVGWLESTKKLDLGAIRQALENRP